jgi:hypothetical protein
VRLRRTTAANDGKSFRHGGTTEAWEFHVRRAGSGPKNTIDGSDLDAADPHSVDAPDMWLATTYGTTPVWIQYEFDRVLKFCELCVWNDGVMFEAVLGFGLKDVTVEHSLDGVEWIVLGDFELTKGTAKTGYPHNTTVDVAAVSDTSVVTAAQIAAATSVYVGLAVTSRSTGVLTSAELSDVATIGTIPSSSRARTSRRDPKSRQWEW